MSEQGKSSLSPAKESANDHSVSENIFEQPMLDGQLDSSNGSQLVSAAYTEYTSGPLPSALELERYKQIDSNLPREIVDMAVREQQHRHSLESQEATFRETAITAEQNNRFKVTRTGQNFGLVAVLAVVGCALVALHNGYPEAAALITGLNLAAVISAFVLGNKNDSGETTTDKNEE